MAARRLDSFEAHRALDIAYRGRRTIEQSLTDKLVDLIARLSRFGMGHGSVAIQSKADKCLSDKTMTGLSPMLRCRGATKRPSAARSDGDIGVNHEKPRFFAARGLGQPQ